MATDPLVGTRPEALIARSTQGALVSIPTPGRVTVVDYWATYCKPCVASLTKLEALHRRHGAAGLSVVGVASDDNPGVVRAALSAAGVSYPNVLDDDARTLARLGAVARVPVLLVFDRSGTLRFVTRGDPNAASNPEVEALEDLIPRLLEGTAKDAR
jgi:thiol-disulfide isomerase/thioredoxin